MRRGDVKTVTVARREFRDLQLSVLREASVVEVPEAGLRLAWHGDSRARFRYRNETRIRAPVTLFRCSDWSTLLCKRYQPLRDRGVQCFRVAAKDLV